MLALGGYDGTIIRIDYALKRGVAMRYTPGPWAMTKQASKFPTYSLTTPDSLGKPIASVHFLSDCNKAEEVANARLIAAGPELLEAAKAVCEKGEAVMDPRLRRLLQAAILKAEGKE